MTSRVWGILDTASFSRIAARDGANRSITGPSGVAKANAVNNSRDVLKKTTYIIKIFGNKLKCVGEKLKERVLSQKKGVNY